jgi:hypothetical protein
MKSTHTCTLAAILSLMIFLPGCGQDNQAGLTPGVPPTDSRTPEQRRSGLTTSPKGGEGSAGQGEARSSTRPANYPK